MEVMSVTQGIKTILSDRNADQLSQTRGNRVDFTSTSKISIVSRKFPRARVDVLFLPLDSPERRGRKGSLRPVP